jgi:hypothetical protein
MASVFNHYLRELASSDFKACLGSGFQGKLILHDGSTALERWKSLLPQLPGGCLFHSAEWIELLRSAYNLRFVVAELRERERVLSGILMAHPYPRWISNRLSALPFSDFCPPLEAETGAAAALLEKLAQSGYSSRFEVRGACASSPWQVNRTFMHWQVDCEIFRRGMNTVLGTAFRREVKRGRDEGLTIESGSNEAFFDRFYRLQLQTRRRLGLPSQSRSFFRQVHHWFGSRNLGEVWIAHRGGIDHAGVVLLSEKDVLHFKWGARSSNMAAGANHLLHWHIIENHSNRYRQFDLGRTGTGNDGLSRWKRHLGGRPNELGYSYLPAAPKVANSEELSGVTQKISKIWSRLPIPVTEFVGTRLYRFLG